MPQEAAGDGAKNAMIDINRAWETWSGKAR